MATEDTQRQIRNIIRVYQDITRKLPPSFTLNEGGGTVKTLTTFINRLDKEFGGVNNDRLVDFLIYAFYTRRNCSTKDNINKVFGPMAIKKFKERKREMTFYENSWLQIYKINRKDLVALIQDRTQHPLAEYIYLESEDHTKSRFLNQEIGYMLCQQSTLGWTPASPACQTCKFISDCQEETKTKYPEIYKLRRENGD